MEQAIVKLPITTIVGLGNPGQKYYHHRHNIGFHVVDELARKHGGTWESKVNMEVAGIVIHEKKVLLVKPETFMNESGKVIPLLRKQGIKPENILVIHDELEKPFGNLAFKVGGSARGHNGLRSIIDVCGKDFARLCFGIGRPLSKDEVKNYVLHDFTEDATLVEQAIGEAITMLEALFESSVE